MSNLPEKVRIDKWLWAVRMYKTRSIAAEACEKGRVKISDTEAKASRNVKVGEIIIIHRGPWHQSVKVLQLVEKRMSGVLSKNFVEDITPPEETERLKLHQAALASFTMKDGGRPTKKDRRSMDEFLGDW